MFGFTATTCPHCKNKSFELHEEPISGANYRMFFVQCSQCGAPITAVEYFDAGALLKGQETKLKEIETKIDHLDSLLRRVANALPR